MNSHSLYKLFSIGKSTAWVVPVLSIFLANEKEISVSEIVYIAGLFGILPFFLEIPFGLLSDKWSNNKILHLGLLSFIAGFISIVFLDDVKSYIFYMLFITLSSSLFSGAEDKLLSAIVKNDQIQQFKFELNSLFYKATIPMILFGGVLYHIDPYLPFYFQIASFSVSLLALYKMQPVTQSKVRYTNSAIELIRSSTYDIYSIYFLVITLVGSICGFLVSINTRTIQIHFEQLIDNHPTVVISVFFIIGNIVSAITSDLYKRHLLNKWRLELNILILGLLVSLSFLLMSVGSIVAVFAGFLILCSFKSAYRPIVSANLMTAIRDTQYLSTAMSIAAMLSAIVGIALSYIYSLYFTTFESINLILSGVIAFTFFIISIVIYQHKESITEELDVRSMSDKKHFVKRLYSSWSYIQIYPHAECVNKVFIPIENRNYPSPKLLSHDGNIVEWEYISGELLSNLHREQQLAVVHQLGIIIKDLHSKFQTGDIVIHGDLHPDNILIRGDNVYVIDWDLAEVGDPMFDGLTFITSPKLDLINSERVGFISEHFNVSENEASQIISNFLNQKNKQLKKLVTMHEVDSYFTDLVDAYQQLLESFLPDKSYEH